ncbi:hypothetical protein CC86DRAFT_470949 [Ophiobolus disseminans]|uniref:alpha-galactosidase n=1 Tax=Ophiobolus disseminans TaxID=1469910 RepID=A0A6A6ZKC8_9PLEO|nr:hypothetical protein CC86DRAFT_470949 [Ophiobolus disseminans]
MHYSTILALAGAASLANASPLENRAVAKFPAGTVWDIVLNSENTDLATLKKAPGTVIDIDLLDLTEAGDTTTIKELAKTKQVICYFSAGSRENWRKDAKDFGSSDFGKPLGKEWPGENWVNVKSETARVIMKKRIEAAAKAGCSAIDPDNVDGFDGNQDGYGYPRSAYADYVKYMADVARNNNLAIGLKNSLDMILDVLSDIQFAVNEECHEQEECDRYAPVTKAGLAVFNIEYKEKNCSAVPGVTLSSVFKPMDLNAIGGQC